MNVNQLFYDMGKSDAEILRKSAHDMTGTEIIDAEYKIPQFSPFKDYSVFPVGSPVIDDNQVWQLIQPHDARLYEGRPETLRALWSLCHTKNPAKAKAWVEPLGTSGMYMKDECYKDSNGIVWKCKNDNMVYDAEALPSAWEQI